jgi:hypothetical protein
MVATLAYSAFQSRVRDLPLGDRFLVEVAFRDRCQFRIGGVLLLPP